MDSQSVLYNKTGNDEAYTPKYAVLPIIKYIPPKAIVWCPFDTLDSNFVKLIGQTNEVVYSHIRNGKDFFKYEPRYWDVIVSNPPFKGKKEIFERSLFFNKPIALLMTMTWLNDSGSKKVFREAGRDMQLMMFDDRIRFENPYGAANNKITFSSGYYCSDFLPKDIILYGKCRN